MAPSKSATHQLLITQYECKAMEMYELANKNDLKQETGVLNTIAFLSLTKLDHQNSSFGIIHGRKSGLSFG